MCYEDQTIDFEKDIGLYLITGDNNAGKSTIFNAISWCFFEKTPFRKPGDDIDIEFSGKLKGAPTEIEVRFTLDNNKFSIFRKLGGLNGSKQVVSSVSKSGGLQPIYFHADDLISKFLPENIKHLFMFDGEMIKNLFDDDTREGLKNSIKYISDINVLERANRHISSEATKLLKKTTTDRKQSEQIDQLESTIDNNNTRIEDFKKKVSEKNKRINENKQRLDDLDERIEKNKGYEDLLAIKNRSNNERKKSEELIELEEKDMFKMLTEITPFIMVYDKMSKLVGTIDEEIDLHNLPAPIEPSELKKFVKDGKCVCGTKVDEKIEKHFLKLIDEYSKVNEKQYIVDISKDFWSITNSIKDLTSKIEDSRSRIAKNRQYKNEQNLEFDMAVEKLDKIQSIDPEADKASRRDLIDLNNKLTEEVTDLKRDIVQLEADVRNDTITRDNIRRDLAKAEGKNSKINLLQEAMQLIEETIKKTTHDTKNLIERKFNDTFLELSGTTNFTGIKMEDDYSIMLKTADGSYRGPSGFGTGYHKMLGLSIVFALSEHLDNSDFPIMVDNPYDSIAPEHKPTINSYLKKLSKKKQVVVTALDEEEMLEGFSKDDVMRHFFISQKNNVSSVEIKK